MGGGGKASAYAEYRHRSPHSCRYSHNSNGLAVCTLNRGQWKDQGFGLRIRSVLLHFSSGSFDSTAFDLGLACRTPK